MADSREYFEKYLPRKIAEEPDLASSVDAIFQFNIEGAGSWTLDMTGGKGTVVEGKHDNPDCTVSTDAAIWGSILDSPAKALQMVMMKKLKVDNMGLAMSLMKILA